MSQQYIPFDYGFSQRPVWVSFSCSILFNIIFIKVKTIETLAYIRFNVVLAAQAGTIYIVFVFTITEHIISYYIVRDGNILYYRFVVSACLPPRRERSIRKKKSPWFFLSRSFFLRHIDLTSRKRTNNRVVYFVGSGVRVLRNVILLLLLLLLYSQVRA